MTDLEFLSQLLAHMGLEGFGVVEEDRSGTRTLHISVQGDDVGMVIGPRGEMLDALQRIVNLSVRVQSGDTLELEPSRLLIDVNGYRQRREDSIKEMALDSAARVLESGQPITLPPLRAYERRIAHMALQEFHGVKTQSEGEGRDRRLTIFPSEE